MGLGARIREVRGTAGVSLTALARASGLSKGFLSQIERDICMPSVTSLQRIAAALKVQPHRLLPETSPQESSRTSPSDYAITAIVPQRISTVRGELEISIGSPGYKAAFFTMHNGEQLIGGVKVSERGGLAMCLVTDGSILLTSGEQILNLRAGGLAHFDATEPYRISSNTASAQALLILPSGAVMPRVEALSGVLYPPPSAAGTLTGPFKLVAMRAERTRAQRAG